MLMGRREQEAANSSGPLSTGYGRGIGEGAEAQRGRGLPWYTAAVGRSVHASAGLFSLKAPSLS